MAEKKQQQLTKSDIRNALAEDNPQRNSGLSIPMRMESDTLPQSQPDHTYRFALNAVIEDRTDIGMIRTEESNEVAFNLDNVFVQRDQVVTITVYLNIRISGLRFYNKSLYKQWTLHSLSEFYNKLENIHNEISAIISTSSYNLEAQSAFCYGPNNIPQYNTGSQAAAYITEYKNYVLNVYAVRKDVVIIPAIITPIDYIDGWKELIVKELNTGDTISSSTYSSIELSDFVDNGFQLNTDTTKPFAEIKTKSGSVLLYDDDTYTISGLETSITWFVESKWDKCIISPYPSGGDNYDMINLLEDDERLPIFNYTPIDTYSLIYFDLRGSDVESWMNEISVSCNGNLLTKVESFLDLVNNSFCVEGVDLYVRTEIEEMKIISVKTNYYDYSKDFVFVCDRQLADPVITVNSNYRQFKCTMTGGNANGITFRYRFDDSGEWQTIGYNTLTYYPANVSKVSVHAVKEGWNNSNTVEENL